MDAEMANSGISPLLPTQSQEDWAPRVHSETPYHSQCTFEVAYEQEGPGVAYRKPS